MTDTDHAESIHVQMERLRSLFRQYQVKAPKWWRLAQDITEEIDSHAKAQQDDICRLIAYARECERIMTTIAYLDCTLEQWREEKNVADLLDE